MDSFRTAKVRYSLILITMTPIAHTHTHTHTHTLTGVGTALDLEVAETSEVMNQCFCARWFQCAVWRATSATYHTDTHMKLVPMRLDCLLSLLCCPETWIWGSTAASLTSTWDRLSARCHRCLVCIEQKKKKKKSHPPARFVCFPLIVIYRLWKRWEELAWLCSKDE